MKIRIRLIWQAILGKPIIYGCRLRASVMPDAFEVMGKDTYIANNHLGWKVILLPLLQRHLKS